MGMFVGDRVSLEGELATLRERLARAEALLRTVEWSPEPSVVTSTCPWCLREQRAGHSKGCELGAFLHDDSEVPHGR